MKTHLKYFCKKGQLFFESEESENEWSSKYFKSWTNDFWDKFYPQLLNW